MKLPSATQEPKTASEKVLKILWFIGVQGPPGHWLDQHMGALLDHERGVDASKHRFFEASLIGTIVSLAAYADIHRLTYESPIGNDGVLGPAFLNMLKGYRTLLNGELGRLDGATLDRAILALYAAAGFEDEL